MFGLRLCFAHGGGAFPALLGRIQHGFDCRPDLVAARACGVTPTEHFSGEVVSSPAGLEAGQGQIWIDSLMHDPDLMEYVIRKLGPGGADRIVLGSDYPFPLGEAMPGELIESIAEFDAKTRERQLSGTALEFLAVSRERFLA